jgi:transglutaminase-like putative cysteine protease
VVVVKSIRRYLGRRLRFARDPARLELLETPDGLLRRIDNQGFVSVDCDGAAILAAALGLALGLRARFVVVGFFSPSAPYSHVWTELLTPAGWLQMDVTRRAQRITPGLIRRRFVSEV